LRHCGGNHSRDQLFDFLREQGRLILNGFTDYNSRHSSDYDGIYPETASA
jgi:hypothetical protein